MVKFNMTEPLIGRSPVRPPTAQSLRPLTEPATALPVRSTDRVICVAGEQASGSEMNKRQATERMALMYALGSPPSSWSPSSGRGVAKSVENQSEMLPGSEPLAAPARYSKENSNVISPAVSGVKRYVTLAPATSATPESGAAALNV